MLYLHVFLITIHKIDIAADMYLETFSNIYESDFLGKKLTTFDS